ncbi:MAG: NUDIX hydrolase [Fimbriiglobus sp.]|jgi:8-oxo-dGTP diphosphatase|nr:NUDIX hydrolase [Fimbriiglobus sp.]
MPAKKARNFTYDYPRPALTVDAVVVTREVNPRVLLIKRAKDPFTGRWALPGGFANENERLTDAAQRELEEETGLTMDDLEQLCAMGDPGRDPRGWTVSVVFFGRVDAKRVKQTRGADDAAEAKWFRFDELPELAFDHADILKRAAGRLAERGW